MNDSTSTPEPHSGQGMDYSEIADVQEVHSAVQREKCASRPLSDRHRPCRSAHRAAKPLFNRIRGSIEKIALPGLFTGVGRRVRGFQAVPGESGSHHTFISAGPIILTGCLSP